MKQLPEHHRTDQIEQPRRHPDSKRLLQVAAIGATTLSFLTGCSNTTASESSLSPAEKAEQQNAAAIAEAAQAENDATQLIDRYLASDSDEPTLPEDAVIIKETITDGGNIGTAVDDAMHQYSENSPNGKDVTWIPAQNGITNAASAHVAERLGITMPHTGDVVSVVIYDADGNPTTTGHVAIPIDVTTK